jgi:hypothetical protein
LKSTEIYLRADPSEKLTAIEASLPPDLRRGVFQVEDRLIAWLSGENYPQCRVTHSRRIKGPPRRTPDSFALQIAAEGNEMLVAAGVAFDPQEPVLEQADTIWARCLRKALKYLKTPEVRSPRSHLSRRAGTVGADCSKIEAWRRSTPFVPQINLRLLQPVESTPEYAVCRSTPS